MESNATRAKSSGCSSVECSFRKAVTNWLRKTGLEKLSRPVAHSPACLWPMCAHGPSQHSRTRATKWRDAVAQTEASTHT
eukprot:5460792-Prymnesium_polylepis.1